REASWSSRAAPGSARPPCSRRPPRGRPPPGGTCCGRGGPSSKATSRSPSCGGSSSDGSRVPRRPSGGGRRPGAPRRAARGGADASFAVLHSLYWLTVNLAERGPGLLLAIDDAHWADASSRRWLAYLVPRIDSPAIAVVVAMRPPDPSASDESLIAVRDAATAVV